MTPGLKDVDEAINPEILTNFYSGSSVNKLGTGMLTLNAGTGNHSEPITVSTCKMSVYGGYASVPVSVTD
jgi:hypothetical protein